MILIAAIYDTSIEYLGVPLHICRQLCQQSSNVCNEHKFLYTYVLLILCVSQTGVQEDASMLLVVDNGEKHAMSVWEWQQQKMIAKSSVRVVNRQFRFCVTVSG